jgi:hypothetical protein
MKMIKARKFLRAFAFGACIWGVAPIPTKKTFSKVFFELSKLSNPKRGGKTA